MFRLFPLWYKVIVKVYQAEGKNATIQGNIGKKSPVGILSSRKP
jgi:hypothetical protein